MKKKKVLIIDDQLGMRMMLQQVFLENDYEVEMAVNGMEGLVKAELCCPHIILVDMKMPGMTGIEFVEKLNQRQLCNKVILMTAYTEQEMLDNVNIPSIRKCLTKPFNIEELMQIVEELDLENS